MNYCPYRLTVRESALPLTPAHSLSGGQTTERLFFTSHLSCKMPTGVIYARLSIKPTYLFN